MVTCPAPELLIAAPPPPDALPLKIESTISRRPGRGGVVGWTTHGYSAGSSWLMPPPTFPERLSLTMTLLEAGRALVPVLDAGAALVGVRLAHREVLEEDVARVRVDLEEAVHPALLDGRALERPAGVDDGEGHARALDRHRVRDVVVTGRAGVLVQRRDLELVDAGRDLDDLPTAECVRLHDRGAQGAVPARRRTVAVAGAAVGLVERARDEELGAVRGERARQAGGRDDDDDRGNGGGPDVPPSKPPAVCVVGLLLPARTPEQSPEIPNAPGPPPQLKRLPAVGFPA